MDSFQQLVRQKAQALRDALEKAREDVPLAGRLLESMKKELEGLESGAITPPYDISQWRIYVGDDYEISSRHPEVSEAFADLELVLYHGDMEAYVRTRDNLERLAKPHRTAGSRQE